MARPSTITNDQLLEAARQEFLAHGIRATSAAIARRAGVSQGILFHRFGTKEALFAAAMTSEGGAPATPLDVDLRSLVGQGSVQQNLITLGERLLDRFFLVVPTQLMAWANPDPERADQPAAQYRNRGIRGQQLFVEYLRGEMRRNRVANVDPFVVAQTFSGALWFFAFEQLSGGRLRRNVPAPSRNEFVRQLVDTLWRGLKP
ncbi:MAG TPA: helix-turn-helix domain-containing protein [Gemmatimonadales bacterium]|nr:helix-turn-helix domain-containing protein [Gemmatimonadales bacterium]